MACTIGAARGSRFNKQGGCPEIKPRGTRTLASPKSTLITFAFMLQLAGVTKATTAMRAYLERHMHVDDVSGILVDDAAIATGQTVPMLSFLDTAFYCVAQVRPCP